MTTTALRRPVAAAPPPGARGAVALAALAGLGLGATVVLTLATQSLDALARPGEPLIALGRLTGMLGAYALLVLVLLVARIPPIERVVGQDRLVAWHRRVGPWPLVLVAAHGALITLGYAQGASAGPLRQLWTLMTTYPGVLAATVGFALLLAAAVTSIRLARRRMAYETWWSVHLYAYLALGVSFSHQVATGQSFVGHPLARALWTAMWIGGAATVLAFRVALPAWRSLRHRLRVMAVERAGPGVVSIVCSGRALDRLPVEGGQFLQWRFLRRGLWWQAHPYSLSALPRGDRLRLTVKDLGDHSAGLARLRPGTRVAFEGPYGAFTRRSLHGAAALLVGGGVGIAPVRALLEDLPPGVRADVLVRASRREDLVMRDELAALAAAHGGRLHELVGPRERVRLDAEALRALVPDVARRDVYVCGPEGLMDLVADSARSAGVPDERIHREEFSF